MATKSSSSTKESEPRVVIGPIEKDDWATMSAVRAAIKETEPLPKNDSNNRLLTKFKKTYRKYIKKYVG